ncbi:unnamed protein product [Peronospora destructor]|uniref:PH domain-containing protein n=1 Tax=Peronospora destructor TaxID=86335 RepID=A0AAV0V5R5_9STRA|nr:unnamed protein product [Peronospora destructor]
MEGYMIRVPMEACFPDTCPAWEQKSNAHRPVHSRVLYYVLEEGYLRGYKTPNDVNDPVESFRLTSNRIKVNTMCSLNIFEIKARVGRLCLPQQFVVGTLSSDTSEDEDNDEIEQADSAALYMPQTTTSSSPNVINKDYHVVFFAANTDLVKKWSVKLLNWTRSVFGSSACHDEAELRMEKAEILHALHAMNAANQFLRPVEIPTTFQAAVDSPAITSEQVSITAASFNLPALANDSSKRTLNETTNATSGIDLADVVKPSDMSTHTQPPNPWWIASFGRHRKISSYSQRC